MIKNYIINKADQLRKMLKSEKDLKINQSKIEEKVKKYVDDQSLLPKYKVELNYQINKGEDIASGKIFLEDPIIILDLDPNINDKLQDIFANTLSGVDFVDDLIYALIKHEKGHLEICPKDVYQKEMLYNLLYKELQDKGSFFKSLDTTIQPNYAFYLLNFFEDIIVNLSNKGDKKFEDGHVFLYYSNFSDDPNISPLYYVFINSQAKFLNKPLSYLFDPNSNNSNDELDKISKDLLAAFVGKEIAEKALEKTLNNDEVTDTISKLKNEANWQNMLLQFMEVILKYFNNPILKQMVK